MTADDLKYRSCCCCCLLKLKNTTDLFSDHSRLQNNYYVILPDYVILETPPLLDHLTSNRTSKGKTLAVRSLALVLVDFNEINILQLGYYIRGKLIMSTLS